jgi:SAM-dependent methyltransferase
VGDVDYARYGIGYARHRRADPRIADLVAGALGPARTVLNVGAGAGSYEPTDRLVVAVEPSETMIAQRPASLGPVVRAAAEALPAADGAFDAAMATVSVHQWSDPLAGLAELRRVATGAVVILTFDPDALDRLWLSEYAPRVYRAERARYPAIDTIKAAPGGSTSVLHVPVPFDCTDGFTEAYFGRPEAFLDPGVRRSQSAWSFVGPDVEAGYAERLADDLASGRWDALHGGLRTQDRFDGALRLVVSGRPARRPRRSR